LDDCTKTGPANTECTLKTNIFGLEEIGVGVFNGTLNSLGFTGKNSSINSEIGRNFDETQIGRELSSIIIYRW
jgi:hypothetical protein